MNQHFFDPHHKNRCPGTLTSVIDFPSVEGGGLSLATLFFLPFCVVSQARCHLLGWLSHASECRKAFK